VLIYAFSLEICFSAQRKALKTPQDIATKRKAPQPPWGDWHIAMQSKQKYATIDRCKPGKTAFSNQGCLSGFIYLRP